MSQSSRCPRYGLSLYVGTLRKPAWKRLKMSYEGLSLNPIVVTGEEQEVPLRTDADDDF
jgi:hypothetical protein